MSEPPSVDTNLAKSRLLRTFRSPILWFALFLGSVMGIGMLLFTTHDVRGVEGLPIESATVLAAPYTGASGCGRNDEPRDLQFRSSNPPQGLPAVFWARDQCHPAVDAGDTVPLAREVKDGTVVKFWINPTMTYGDALWLSLVMMMMTTLIVIAVLLVGVRVRRLWLRKFWHD